MRLSKLFATKRNVPSFTELAAYADQNPSPFALLDAQDDLVRALYTNPAFSAFIAPNVPDRFFQSFDLRETARRACHGETSTVSDEQYQYTLYPVPPRFCGCLLARVEKVDSTILPVLFDDLVTYEYSRESDCLYRVSFEGNGMQRQAVLADASHQIGAFLERYLAPEDREEAQQICQSGMCDARLSGDRFFRRWCEKTCTYRWSLYHASEENGCIRLSIRDMDELKRAAQTREDALLRRIEAAEASIHVKDREIFDDYNALTDLMCSLVEYRSMESGEHVHRIKTFTRALLTEVQREDANMTDALIDCIASVSVLHDVGKIGIDDSVLRKPGRLTEEEFEQMKLHTIFGADIVNRMPFVRQQEQAVSYAYDICRHHHERYDGKGYPDGLIGEQIPFAAQIVSLADAYDALVTERVYKRAYSASQAYDMIQRGECGMFSERILQHFRAVRAEFEQIAQIRYQESSIPLSMANYAHH